MTEWIVEKVGMGHVYKEKRREKHGITLWEEICR